VVTVSVEEIILMQNDFGLFVDRFLSPSSPVTVVICIGSSLVLIEARRRDLNSGANRRSLLIVSYNPCLTAGGEKFLATHGFFVTK